LGAGDIAGIPEVGGIEFGWTRGNCDLVSGLFLTAFGGFDAPGKAGMGLVEAERGLEVLAA